MTRDEDRKHYARRADVLTCANRARCGLFVSVLVSAKWCHCLSTLVMTKFLSSYNFTWPFLCRVSVTGDVLFTSSGRCAGTRQLFMNNILQNISENDRDKRASLGEDYTARFCFPSEPLLRPFTNGTTNRSSRKRCDFSVDTRLVGAGRTHLNCRRAHLENLQHGTNTNYRKIAHKMQRVKSKQVPI